MNSQNPSNTHQSLVATDDDSKIVEIPDSQVKEKQSSARRSFKTAYKIKMRRKPRLRQHGPSVATNRKNLARFDPMVPI